MATSNGEQSSLIAKLFSNPERFDFYQMVRLLEYIKNKNIAFPFTAKKSENKGLFLKKDFVSFSTVSKCSMALSSVVDLELVNKGELTSDVLPKVSVSFIGLTGINGALPHHYTEKLLYNAHNGNYILRDFFDLFNNRIIYLLYQAWKKNHCYASYKTLGHLSERTDSFANSLEGLAGIGSQLLTSSLKVERETYSYYAGLFAGQHRSAMALEALLNEYFELPIKIMQFQGKWLYLSDEERSVITHKRSSKEHFQELGENIILGQRQWSVQNSFRLYIGPLTYRQFLEIKPGSSFFNKLVEITRMYINSELNFDVQLELLALEVPSCCLSMSGPMTLGWNAWLKNKPLVSNDRSFITQIE